MPFPNSKISHSRLMQELGAQHATALTVFRPEIYQDATGEEKKTYSIFLTGLNGIVSPVAGKEEIKRKDGTTVTSAFQIGFQGFYPQLKRDDIILAVGLFHQILGIAHDQQSVSTVVTTEVIEPDTQLWRKVP